MTEDQKDVITNTIRIPREIWLKLRRMQEQGIIKSIQEGCVRALELFIRKEG